MATDPNRFACAQEAALLRDVIAVCEQDRDVLRQRTESARLTLSRAESALHDAQAMFATAQALYASAKSRETALEDDIRVKRSFIHPVRKVPHDLWRLIFLEAQAGALQTSFFGPQGGERVCRAQTLAIRVASVCQRWRNVAQDIPALWRFIHIKVTDGLDSPDIVALRSRLSALRDRYGVGYRNTVFDFYLKLAPGVARDRRFEKFFLDVFWTLQVSRSFEVVASNGYIDYRDSYLSQYFQHVTPHLESLRLTAESYDEEEEDIDSHSVLDPFSRTNYKKLFPACPRLRNVELGNFPMNDYSISVPSKAPEIKHIYIWRVPEFSGMNMSAALRLFPNTPTMQFTTDSAVLSLQASAQYSALRVLRLDISTLKEGFALGLTLPGLERIKLNNTASSSRNSTGFAIADFLMRVCPNVSDVLIVCFKICPLLAPALRSLARLRVLDLCATGLACDELFSPALPSAPVPFPALEELYIEDAHGFEGFTGRQLMDFIRGRFRKEGDGSATLHGPPLRRVFVRWEDQQYHDEPVNEELMEDWDDQYREVVGEDDMRLYMQKDWTPADELGALEQEFMSGYD